MRLLRLRLSDFAGVREREVSFAEGGVTVLVGPNETGKSTLLTALDLLLRLPDSSKAGEVRDAQPVGRDVGPQVEAELTTGPYRLVYTKQWLREPRTTLLVRGPEGTQTFTGRDAHDRAEAIFETTLDRTLWDALRVEQGQLSQVPLAESAWLQRALDQAAGGGLGGPEEQGLFERAEAERRRYLTADRGNPTGGYRAASQAAAEARAQAEELRTQLGEVERLTQDIPRLENELARLVRGRATEAARLEELAGRHRAVQAQRGEVAALDVAATRAEGRHSEAAKVSADRQALAARVQDVAALVARLRRRLDDAPEVDALRAAKEAADDAWRQAQKAADEAGRARVLAQTDLDHLRDGDTLKALTEREGRARAALERLRAAEAVLAATAAVTTERLAGLEKAQRAVDRAAAQLQVASARVEVAALTDVDLRIGPDDRPLTAGETAEYRVPDALEIGIPGRLTVRVYSGSNAEQLRHDHDRVRTELRRLLAEAGVDSVGAARQALQECQAAQERQGRSRAELRDALGEGALEELARRQEVLRQRLATYAAQREAATPPPLEMDEAERRQRDAAAAEKVAREAAERAQARDQEAISELQRAELAEARLRGEMQAAQQALAEVQEALAEARATGADSDLDRGLAEAAEAWRRAREAHERARDAYELLEPEQVELRWSNQRKVLDNIDRQQGGARSELDRAEGALRALRSDGLAERYDEAVRQADRTERERLRLQRLAEAADLLYETLKAHRERMLRNYQAPYREAIEAIGRTVFGAGFGVELGEDLGVARRTLAGETLDFRLLSTGAREQLAVLARLAGATLASGDGVPVILDDAFGYSDPERLARVGAVLAAVGDRCQVIVLTCFPERYQGVGGARFVRVEALESAPRREAAAAAAEAAAAGEPEAPTASVAETGAGDAPAPPATGEPSAGGRVIACLRAAGRPLGKRDLLAGARVADGEWPSVIADLLARGRVERLGQRRGATYRLPGA